MAGFLSFLTPARDSFLMGHDATVSLKLIAPWVEQQHALSTPERRATLELAALMLRAQKRFAEAAAIYQQIPDEYQEGYCYFLQGQLDQARLPWMHVAEKRNNHWCVTLYGMAIYQVNSYPTLFQIRNHLESDIANLLEAGQTQFVENILACAEFLSQINVEAPKFIGRALLNAGQVERARPFLFWGQKIIPNDPEIYYHLGQCHVALNLLKDAQVMLNQCLLISPTYSPAKALLAKLREA